MTPQPLADPDFEAAETAMEAGEALVIDLDGFEGPLHLLLALARTQKVDLLKLSIAKLADQYLAFVQAARRRQFALAADYLVMAAWLTYLKSRLLLPKLERPRGDQPAAEDLAAALALRLSKLEAVRSAVEALRALPQTGRDVFTRGDPDAVVILSSAPPETGLYALVQAYARQRGRERAGGYRPAPPRAYPLEEARNRLRGLMPELSGWTPLAGLAPLSRGDLEPSRASYLASTLSAGLEMVREGALEARQLHPFAELYLRARREGVEAPWPGATA